MATTPSEDLVGQTAKGADEEKLGTVDRVVSAEDAEWMVVKRGRFLKKESFVPVDGCTPESDGSVHMPIDSKGLDGAPNVAGDEPTADEAEALRAHFADVSAAPVDPGMPEPPPAPEEREDDGPKGDPIESVHPVVARMQEEDGEIERKDSDD